MNARKRSFYFKDVVRYILSNLFGLKYLSRPSEGDTFEAEGDSSYRVQYKIPEAGYVAPRDEGSLAEAKHIAHTDYGIQVSHTIEKHNIALINRIE